MKLQKVVAPQYKMPEPPDKGGAYITTHISIHGLEWFPVVTIDNNGCLAFHDCPGCRTLEQAPDYPVDTDHDAGHSITIFFESLENARLFFKAALEAAEKLQGEE
jgi:hypothetical protein